MSKEGQRHPSEYVRAPRFLLEVGRRLEADLFIYMPLNQTFVRFREAGIVLTASDVITVAKVPAANLVIYRSEQNKVLHVAQDQVAKAINSGQVDTPEVRAHAASLLNSGDTTEAARNLLTQVPELVQGMLTQFKRTPSVAAYEQTLARFKSQDDPLDRHHHQVSALSVLIQMTIGGGTPDDLTDLGAAGLIHDLGLAQLPKVILEKHLHGEDSLNNSEQLLYLKHIDILADTIRAQKLAVTPGAIRILELHHENWDGSGFKSLAGQKIYRPARVFRIADEIVSALNPREGETDYRGALLQISARSRLFDPAMIAQLMEVVSL